MFVTIPNAVIYYSLIKIAAPYLIISGLLSNRQITNPLSPALRQSLVRHSTIWTCCPIFPMCMKTVLPCFKYVDLSIIIKLASKFHSPLISFFDRLSTKLRPVLDYFINSFTLLASCASIWGFNGATNSDTSWLVVAMREKTEFVFISLMTNGRYSFLNTGPSKTISF